MGFSISIDDMDIIPKNCFGSRDMRKETSQAILNEVQAFSDMWASFQIREIRQGNLPDLNPRKGFMENNL